MKKPSEIILRLLVIAAAAALLAHHPRSARVRMSFQDLDESQRAGNPREQAEALGELAERLPWRDDLWELCGRFAQAGGDRDRALACYQQAEKRDQLSPEGQYQLGRLYQAAGQPGRAEDVWTPMQTFPEAMRSLAELQVQQGEYRAAVERWDDYLAALPGDPPHQVRAEIGLLQAAVEPWRAGPTLEDAARFSGQAERVYQALAAVEDQEQAYQWVVSGQALGSVGRWGLAEFALCQAVEARPDYVEAWVYWGEAVQQAAVSAPEGGDRDQAEAREKAQEALKEALKLDPDSPLAHMFYGLFLQRQDRHLEAVEHFQAAQTSWPDRPEVYIEQGFSLAKLGDLEGAEEKYLQAVEVNPDRSKSYLAAARFYLNYHYRVKEAGLLAARRAVLLEEEDPDALLTMGRVMLALEDQANALKYFYRSLDAGGGYPPAHLYLGMAFTSLGDQERAHYHLQQVLQTSPDPALRRQAQRMLEAAAP